MDNFLNWRLSKYPIWQTK